MSAEKELVESLRRTDAIQGVLAALDREPVRILRGICSEYERTDAAIPDHHVPGSGFVKDVALRALISAGLLERQPGGTKSIYSYRPTESGMQYYRKLRDEA